MIKKVQITKVFKNDKNKDGVLYSIKKGKDAGQNFIRIGIQTDKTGEDTYYNNAKASDKAMNIEVGQSLLLNFTETPSDDGANIWKNFNFPTKEQKDAFINEQLDN